MKKINKSKYPRKEKSSAPMGESEGGKCVQIYASPNFDIRCEVKPKFEIVEAHGHSARCHDFIEPRR